MEKLQITVVDPKGVLEKHVPSSWSKFFHFHVVFSNFLRNNNTPWKLVPFLGNPGSATELCATSPFAHLLTWTELT